MEFWYPKAVKNIDGIEFKEYGDYLPQGAVIHYNAARGGNAPTPEEAERLAKRLISYLSSKKYGTMTVDAFGKVYQNMPLNKWSAHAGKSRWKGTTGQSVNNEFVGIDLMCAGRVKLKGSKFVTWWGGELPKEHVVHSEDRDNIKEGWYEKCTDLQFEELTRLLVWLNSNFDSFSFDNVVGHDEVSPERKTDPGASLCYQGKVYSMPEYRQYLKDHHKMIFNVA